MVKPAEIDEHEKNLFKLIPNLAKHLEPLAIRGLSLEVGRFSYGKPHVFYQGDKNRRLVIGNFVSIGPDVKIFCGRQGSHPLDLLSTFPMGMIYPNWEGGNADKVSRVFKKNLDVVIGNDVWIGANVIIRAGVTIGHGAVIGAGGVVTSDIPPYTIAGGVPARSIKLRFEKEIVDKLVNLAWWGLPIEILMDNLPKLFHEPDMNKVIETIHEIKSKP